jgi:hypothetical protein
MSGVSGIVVVKVQATLAPIPKQPAYGGGEISPLMEHMSAAMEKVCLFPGSSDFGSVISLGVDSRGLCTQTLARSLGVLSRSMIMQVFNDIRFDVARR